MIYYTIGRCHRRRGGPTAPSEEYVFPIAFTTRRWSRRDIAAAPRNLQVEDSTPSTKAILERVRATFQLTFAVSRSHQASAGDKARRQDAELF